MALCGSALQESEDAGLGAGPIAALGGCESPGWPGERDGVGMGWGRRYGVKGEVQTQHPQLDVISQLVNGDAPAERIVLPHPLLLPAVNLDPFLSFSLTLL